jgi:hypothetical protein
VKISIIETVDYIKENIMCILEMKLMISKMNLSDLEMMVAYDMIDSGYVPFMEAEIREYWSQKLS